MMKDDARKSIPEKKAQATPAPSVSSPRELTCTEGQIEDLFAEGETTESEADAGDADESPDPASTNGADRKSPPSAKASRKQT